MPRYLRAVDRRPGSYVLGLAAVTALSLWAAQRVHVDPRLEALLPAGTPQQRALQELRDRVPGSSPLYLLVESSDATLNRKLALEMRDAVRQWPETRDAIAARDPSFFLERRLLYLPEERLRELADTVEERVRWHECEAVPGCVNLDAQPPVLPDEDELVDYFKQVPDVVSLAGLLGASVDELAAPETSAGNPAQADPRLKGQLCSPDGRVCAVQALLDGTPQDLNYASQILSRAEELFERVRPARAPPDLRLAVSGQYRNAPMTKRVVARDLRRTAILSSALVLLAMMAQFRGLRALLALSVPLVCGAAWTLGLLGLWHARLNVISSFMLAVLAGLGVDYGLHVLTHYGSHRSRGMKPLRAIDTTLRELGSSMLMATATTGCGFGALSAAGFRGFAEMGVVAAAGTILMFLATLVAMPPVLLLAHRWMPEKCSPVRAWPRPRWLGRLPLGASIAALCGGLVIAAVGGWIALDLKFEYDFRNLRPQGVSHGIAWASAMHGTGRSAIVILADSASDLEQVASTLRAEGPGEVARDPDTWLVSPNAFVPAGQGQRLQQIARLRTALTEAETRVDSETQRSLRRWRAWVRVKERIAPSELPNWVTQWLSDTDGHFGRFGLVYTDLSGSDAGEMERLAQHLDGWRERFPGVRFASTSALLGTVIPALRADAPWIVGLALAGLLLGTLVIGRSLRRAALVISPLCLSMALALGALVLMGTRINMYNLLVFPLAFGLGIDGAVYVVWTLKHAAKGRASGALWTTGRAVFGSAATDIAAFGSMLIASNPGLVSLGQTAAVTLSTNVLANLIWLPALLRLVMRRS